MNNDRSDLKITIAAEHERPLIEVLMQPYLQEMSQFDASSPQAGGLYDLGKYFPLYWTEKNRFPYLLMKQSAAIGFALVRELSQRTFSMAEFFITNEQRGQGIGEYFAKEIFRCHEGKWQVAQLKNNTPAQKFWRSVVQNFTDGNFSEDWSSDSPEGPMQTFVSCGLKSA